MQMLVKWVRGCSLVMAFVLVGGSGFSALAAEEDEAAAFTNLIKGPDGRYHLKGEGQKAGVVAGEAEFQTYCASCHGVNAKGDGPIVKFLKEKPADLTQIAMKNGGEFPFWATYRMIDGREAIEAHGGREMPVWGDEFKEQVPKMVQAKSGKQAYAKAQEERAESKVKGRILELVLYLQSIQAK